MFMPLIFIYLAVNKQITNKIQNFLFIFWIVCLQKYILNKLD